MITVFSRASLPMERGVGRIYSQSRGRGHRKFFWGLRPQTPSGSPLLFSPPNPKCAPRSLVLSRGSREERPFLQWSCVVIELLMCNVKV